MFLDLGSGNLCCDPDSF